MRDTLSAFTGTEPPPPHLALDSNALMSWVGNRLPGFDAPIEIAKFKGGQSNPTYRIATRRGNYVLRRKPPGPLRRTAHAIDREFRVLTALVATDVPIPQPHLYCSDETVIGSEFYIVDAVEGVIHWDAELPGETRPYRTAYYNDLIECLARIHSVDWQQTGLEGFGGPSNYTARNLQRWYRSFTETKSVAIPDMDWVARALKERLPEQEPISLIHGDYGNHNIIAAGSAPRVIAVLDWEMSTIGNPLIDLAHSLRPWFGPPDRNGQTFIGKDLAALGIPSMEEVVESYTEQTGLRWKDREFHLAFVLFRTAAMVQGILHRHSIGTAANKTLAHNQDRIFALAKQARAILTGLL